MAPINKRPKDTELSAFKSVTEINTNWALAYPGQ